MSRIKFNCLCGHNEKTHNFDPDSIMFGCLYEMITIKAKMSGTQRSTVHCDCREFRGDNLRYLEDHCA
jgi:hypothetical protein